MLQPYMDIASVMVICPWPCQQITLPDFLYALHEISGYNWPSGFCEAV